MRRAATGRGGIDRERPRAMLAGVRLEQEFFSPARERLGESRWDTAYTEGARLDFDEAMSLALNEG